MAQKRVAFAGLLLTAVFLPAMPAEADWEVECTLVVANTTCNFDCPAGNTVKVTVRGAGPGLYTSGFAECANGGSAYISVEGVETDSATDPVGDNSGVGTCTFIEGVGSVTCETY